MKPLPQENSEPQQTGAWLVLLNVAAMHLSGALLFVALGWIPAVSTKTYSQVFGLMTWFLVLHVSIQVPAGILVSRWAARGQVLKAGSVALALATSVVCALYWCVERQPLMWDLWWQSWCSLCVSLSGYVWLCSLRRSTVQRLTDRVSSRLGTVVMWALLRPPRHGPR
ncbi:hypothetical protein [Streptomyces sp. NRRL F-2799]|uniref:hypothetical protein n=1 Tax=Streptomyces sp. NRRL F-2799 TaxID=1463844 RepID=UPI0004C4804C|nr:hypothetical protein [Streptomyces sp. NRRL F-2799]